MKTWPAGIRRLAWQGLPYRAVEPVFSLSGVFKCGFEGWIQACLAIFALLYFGCKGVRAD